MSNAPETTAAYRILGTTDEHTVCDCCGRVDLKTTVGVEDTATGAVAYMGSDCAARHSGYTVKVVRAAAKDADREAREAREAAKAAHHRAVSAKRDELLKAAGHDPRNPHATLSSLDELRAFTRAAEAAVAAA